MNIKYCLITLLCGSFAIASTANAQDTPKEEPPTTMPTKATKDGKAVAEKTDEEKAAEKEKLEAKAKLEKAAADAAEALRIAEETKAAAAKEKEAEEKNGGFSPIAELADKDFVPMKEINEEELEQIIPGRVHPRVDWTGLFRLRTGIRNNFDLDTQGTSRVRPPAESYVPIGNPADADAESHWSTNLSLRIEPTIFITEDIKIHTEIALLNNLILGSLPTTNSDNPLGNTASSSSQFSGEAGSLFQNLLEINELYGEVNTVFATLYAGRMDDVWGLGMYTSDGDCNDCNFGNHVDRVKLQTNLFGFYLTGTWDFPTEGVTTRSPFSFGGQPYDVSQIDEADQWTLSVEKVARTREELEKQSDALLNDNAWIPEGGIQYRYQSQQGAFVPQIGGDGTFDASEPPTLIYRGASVHVVDAWGRLIYQPEEDRFIKINIEALGAFGNVDNVTNGAVGEPDTNEALINCFDEDVRNGNQERCTTDSAGNSTERSLTQFGLALETEFRFNSPVTFGLNGGFASGGKSPAWGTRGTTDLDFFRFNPDYHVDLILFREVIGTVTNAYYVNPNLNLRFFETAGRHLELNVDAIFSGVLDTDGGVANDGLLGFELDAGISYIMRDLFTATIEGGMLFPFNGLAAETGRARYTVFGSNPQDFTTTTSATIPWTVQGKLNWNF